MSDSMLAAIRNAIIAPPEQTASLSEAEIGAALTAAGLIPQEKNMETGITQAAFDAAVADARAEGAKAGADAERARLSAALGADGVKGDAARMSAAIDLAGQASGMTGEAIASFVGGNVSSAPKTGAESYEANRVLGAGLAQPTAPAGNVAASAWGSVSDRINKRR